MNKQHCTDEHKYTNCPHYQKKCQENHHPAFELKEHWDVGEWVIVYIFVGFLAFVALGLLGIAVSAIWSFLHDIINFILAG